MARQNKSKAKKSKKTSQKTQKKAKKKIEKEINDNLSNEELEAEKIDLEGIETEGTTEVEATLEALNADAQESVKELQVDTDEKIEIDDTQLSSILESLLFAAQKPITVAVIKSSFTGTDINTARIRSMLNKMAIDFADAKRGVYLEEVQGGYQLRTKLDNMNFLRRSVKGRPFKISGPSMEVMAIVAYKQPLIKSEIDQIRGVESGHLVRALMDRGMIQFAGKSELPGKPMLYKTTRKFLEVFGLNALNELPTLSEIEEIIPEGIGGEEDDQTLDQLTDDLSLDYGERDTEAEEQYEKVTDKLSEINTSSEFFEQEKQRQRKARDKDRADDIRERIILEQDVEPKDAKWLERYEAKIESEEQMANEVTQATSAKPEESSTPEIASEEVKAEAEAEAEEKSSQEHVSVDSLAAAASTALDDFEASEVAEILESDDTKDF